MLVSCGQSVHGEAEIVAVVNALRSSLRIGTHVRQMEASIAELFAKSYGVMVNSGASANCLAIEVLRFAAGTEVITPALTSAATIAPIVHAGLVPAFVDVLPATYNIDVDGIAAMVTPRTRAIMVPSLLGNLPDWDAIMRLADRFNLVVIEDGADAIGATLHDRAGGERSHLSTTAFAAGGVIHTAGGGGMLCVDDEELARRARLLRSRGRAEAPETGPTLRHGPVDDALDALGAGRDELFEMMGFDFEPSELGAAFGLVQLDKLEASIAARERNFAAHASFFEHYEHWFELPRQLRGARAGWTAFPLTLREDAPFARDALAEHFARHGVETRPIHTGNILRQPAMAGRSHRASPTGYPVADRIMRGGLLLGCHHGLGARQIDHVHSVMHDFAEAF